MLYLRTFGTIQLATSDDDDDCLSAGRKPLLVLAYLALERGSAERSTVAGVLWPGQADQSARSLNMALYQLREIAGVDLVVDVGGRLVLDTEGLSVDASDFREEVKRGGFEEAARLYRGPLLRPFQGKVGREFAGWLVTHDDAMLLDLSRACHGAVESCMGRGDAAAAERYARLLLTESPLSDAAVRLLVYSVLIPTSQDHEAARTIERLRTLLATELEAPLPGDLDETLDNILASYGPDAVARRPITPERPATTGRLSAAPRRARRLRIVGASVVALTVLGIGALTWSGSGTSDLISIPAGWTDDLGVHYGLVHLTSDGVRFEALDLVHEDVILDPTGRFVARTVLDTLGEQLVVTGPDRETTAIDPGEGDRRPLEWAPGRPHLLFSAGRFDSAAGRFMRELWVWDASSRETRRLGDWLIARPSLGASWSPQGDLIAAVVEGDSAKTSRLVVMDAAGGHRSTVVEGQVFDPSWSLDGERLAFTVIEDGRANVYARHWRGGPLASIARGLGMEGSPVWLAHDIVAFSSMSSSSERLGVAVLDAGTIHYFDAPGLGRLLPRLAARYRSVPHEGLREALEVRADLTLAPDDVEPLEHLVLTLPSTFVSAGEYIKPNVRVEDTRGRPVAPQLALEWESVPPDAVLPVGEGWFRVMGVDQAELVARVPGGLADTLRLTLQEPDSTPRPLLLSEDWTSGISAGWKPFGDPLSVVATSPSLGGRPTLDPNGDERYKSGVVWETALSIERGLTVEVEMVKHFTGRLYEHFGFGVVDSLPPSQPREHAVWAPQLAGRAALVDLSHSSTSYLTPGTVPGVPGDAAAVEWLAIQWSPTGSATLLVDGRVFARSNSPLSPLPDSVRLWLFGASMGAEIGFGRVRVYEGERWVWPPG